MKWVKKQRTIFEFRKLKKKTKQNKNEKQCAQNFKKDYE